MILSKPQQPTFKENLYYKRRVDPEIGGVENIWIELAENHKRILFGVFFIDTEFRCYLLFKYWGLPSFGSGHCISDIIVTGDFNLNVLNVRTTRKIESLCTQFSFYQSFDQPTHFTENSSSLIDIVLVSDKVHLLLSGVGDPFLNQDRRYHCPMYGIFKFF